MKTKYSTALVLLALTAAPFLAVAKTLEETYIENFPKAAGSPVPTAVVTPVVGREVGGRVTAQCVIGASGKPSSICVTSDRDNPALVAAVTKALAQWKFKPAEKNGRAVATNVVIPFEFIRGNRPETFTPDFVLKAAE